MRNSVSQTITVSSFQTAESLGSGLLPVFSTPALVALMENTAMHLIDTPDGKSSVGVMIQVKHLKASPVGAKITCTATLVANEGRGYSFELVATDESGDRVGEGTHERVLIDVEKFMSKVK